MNFKNGISEYVLCTGSGLFAFLGKFSGRSSLKSNDTYQYKCGLLLVAVRHSKTPELNLNFIRGNENVTHSAQGQTAFWGEFSV